MNPDTTQNKQISLAEFGQKIKAKYPQYSDLADEELGQKMLAKYPQYNDMVSQKIPEKPKGDLLSRITNAVTSIFPGGKVGDLLGSLYDKVTLPKEQAQNVSLPSATSVLGDLGQIGLTVGGLGIPGGLAAKVGMKALPAIGEGASGLGRIGSNLALGAGFGASGALAEDRPEEALNRGITGGVIGAGIGGAGNLFESLSKNLPSRIVQKVIPKIENKTANYALENTPLGTPATMLKESKGAVQSLGGQIDSILQHPDYTSQLGNGAQAIQDTLSQFPNSDYNAEHIIGKMKDLVPEVSKLVQKIADGDANLFEKNVVRKAVDNATKSVYTSLNRPPEIKSIGAAFAGALRNEVKSFAPETDPVFQKLQQEINLRNGLNKLTKRMEGASAIGLKDLMGAAAGGTFAGAPGALGGMAVEKALTSPTINMSGAKLLNALGKSKQTGQIANFARVPFFRALLGNQSSLPQSSLPQNQSR